MKFMCALCCTLSKAAQHLQNSHGSTKISNCCDNRNPNPCSTGMEHWIMSSILYPDNVCPSVCPSVTEVMSLPIWGPISACIMSATVTWPHCEPVVLPHYYTLDRNPYCTRYPEPNLINEFERGWSSEVTACLLLLNSNSLAE